MGDFRCFAAGCAAELRAPSGWVPRSSSSVAPLGFEFGSSSSVALLGLSSEKFFFSGSALGASARKSYAGFVLDLKQSLARPILIVWVVAMARKMSFEKFG